jgi:hypothetical protein
MKFMSQSVAFEVAVLWVVAPCIVVVEVYVISDMLAALVVRAMMMVVEAGSTSGASVNFYISQDSHLRTRRRENLKCTGVQKVACCSTDSWYVT